MGDDLKEGSQMGYSAIMEPSHEGQMLLPFPKGAKLPMCTRGFHEIDNIVIVQQVKDSINVCNHLVHWLKGVEGTQIERTEYMESACASVRGNIQKSCYTAIFKLYLFAGDSSVSEDLSDVIIESEFRGGNEGVFLIFLKHVHEFVRAYDEKYLLQISVASTT